MQRDEVSAFDYDGLYEMRTPQRFDNQMVCEDGVFKPTKPIEDPDLLDERRNAPGLIKLPNFCRLIS